MDPVQSLAILFAGAFLMVLITLVFYVFTVRPRLLEGQDTLVAQGDERLYTEITEQRTLIQQLNQALRQHTEQLQVNTMRVPASQGIDELREILRVQTTMNGLIGEQAGKLNHHEMILTQTTQQVEQISSVTLPHILSQISAQGEKLDRLESKLNQPLADQNTLVAERLMAISTRLDAWAIERAQEHEKLAENARILAELDRQLAAQAQVTQQIDTKVSEHTTMLLTAATERREQAGVLVRVVDQLGEFFPIMRQLIFSRPQTESKKRTPVPGQDRLTDIKGIGPVYAGKLYEAGIYTFRQLASMSPDEVRVLIDAPTWRQKAVNAESWIEQAGLFASQREKVEDLS